jgi:hypothetical protein
MKIVQVLIYGCITLGALSLSLACLAIDLTILAISVLLLVFFWAVAFWRGWDWAVNSLFGLNVIILGSAAWLGANLIWIFIALAGFIAAWDLGRWIRLAGEVDHILYEGLLVKQHLFRLGGVLVIGLGLSFLALNLDFKYSFDWALILAFVMVLALSRVVGFLRQG